MSVMVSEIIGNLVYLINSFHANSNENNKLYITGSLWGDSIDGYHSQSANNVESIWFPWHDVTMNTRLILSKLGCCCVSWKPFLLGHHYYIESVGIKLSDEWNGTCVGWVLQTTPASIDSLTHTRPEENGSHLIKYITRYDMVLCQQLEYVIT